MTRLVWLVATALVLVPSAVGASGAKTIATRGEVTEISADGGRVAIHAVLGRNPGCDSASVWQPATGKVVRLVDTPCGSNQSDDEFDQVTLAGSRLVWTDYDFGNHAYCTGPYLASLAKPMGANSSRCPEEPDNTDLYWEYRGDGGLLVARSYTLCEADCEPNFDRTYDADVTIWTLDAAGPKKLLAAKDDTELFDVDAGRILLHDPAKKLLVLSPAGKQVGAVTPAEVGAAFMSGPSQVVTVSKGTTLSVYDLTGKLLRTRKMKGEGKLMDVENGVAAYFSATEVRLLTLATGADRLVAKQAGLVQADLEQGGLFYAYNVPHGGSKPGRVTYAPLK